MRRHKPEIAVAALLLLTPVLVWVYWDLRLSWGIRAEWNRIRAEGYPASLDDLTPALVPDEQNAAIGYMCAMRELTSLDRGARAAGVPSPKREALDAADAYYPGASPARRERLRHALDAPIVKRALAETVRASRLPACVFPRHQPAFPDADAYALRWDEHMVLLTHIGDLVGQLGALCHADGDTAAALECDLTRLRIARHALQCRSLPAQMAGSEMLVGDIRSIDQMLSTGMLTQAQVATVRRELDAIDLETPLCDTIAHARVLFADEVFRTRGSLRNRLKGRCPPGGALPGVPYTGRWLGVHETLHGVRARLYFTPVGVPWHKRDELEFLRMCRRLIDMARLPNPGATRVPDQVRRDWCGGPGMAAMAPASSGFARYGLDAVSNRAWVANTIAECRVAIALQVFHGRYGRYPESIDELAANSAVPVPEDPWSGEPFRYRLADGGACEYYSVGPNGRDDGGEHTVLIINLGDLIEDDLVHRCVPGQN